MHRVIKLVLYKLVYLIKRTLMSEIDEYELKVIRQKLISQYQDYQAIIDSENSDESHTTSAGATGQIAGRSVTQIDSTNSRETQLYQRYVNHTN